MADNRRAGRAVAGAALLALGVVSEHKGFGLHDPAGWVPDVIAGMALVLAGVYSRRWDRGTGTLLVATGLAWFAGPLVTGAMYWHRGPLAHAVTTYRGWRPSSPVDGVIVVAAYVLALLPVGRSESWNVAVGLALVGVAAVHVVGASGRRRRDKAFAFGAAIAVGAVMVGGAVVRVAVPSGAAIQPIAHAYEAVLVVAAVVLAAGLRSPDAAAVADLVVDLDETRSGTVRDALARALGDPSLQIGFIDERGEVRGVRGELIEIPAAGSGRVATFLEADRGPFAVLVHDPAVLSDPTLMDAVTSVARLSQTNAALTAEVREQLAELADSRRRLVTVADDERRVLELQVRDGTERRLRTVRSRLERLDQSAAHPSTLATHLGRAQDHLVHAMVDLDDIARGLHPTELAGGLDVALRAMAARAPITVEVSACRERVSDEVAAAAYFVCAEALTNVAKHAAATHAAVEVAIRPGWLIVTISDDGIGGADATLGTGLRGLGDRVGAVGGKLRVDSKRRVGTRLVAELPLGDQRS